jgi:nucleotide-binding universal stress UspA family protein
MAIVVGVDGSEASKEALRWAVGEARLRRAKVRALRAYEVPFVPPVLDPFGAVPAVEGVPGIDRELLRQASEEGLARVVSEVVPDPGGVEIELQVAEGHAAEVLVATSKDAELLVVGSRGHGGFAGLLLGSVSQSSAQHAYCPVVIVRP